jgi:hypothetical protein
MLMLVLEVRRRGQVKTLGGGLELVPADVGCGPLPVDPVTPSHLSVASSQQKPTTLRQTGGHGVAERVLAVAGPGPRPGLKLGVGSKLTLQG